MVRYVLVVILFFTTVFVNAQAVISGQKIPIFGSTDSVYHYYSNNREFLKKKFFIETKNHLV
jgi:hypothetical protein